MSGGDVNFNSYAYTNKIRFLKAGRRQRAASESDRDRADANIACYSLLANRLASSHQQATQGPAPTRETGPTRTRERCGTWSLVP